MQTHLPSGSEAVLYTCQPSSEPGYKPCTQTSSVLRKSSRSAVRSEGQQSEILCEFWDSIVCFASVKSSYCTCTFSISRLLLLNMKKHMHQFFILLNSEKIVLMSCKTILIYSENPSVSRFVKPSTMSSRFRVFTQVSSCFICDLSSCSSILLLVSFICPLLASPPLTYLRASLKPDPTHSQFCHKVDRIQSHSQLNEAPIIKA